MHVRSTSWLLAILVSFMPVMVIGFAFSTRAAVFLVTSGGWLPW
ncbi:MAG: hypothetical protein QGF59_04305 [Pirellulaceae bacterium]|nr:hypothetical protein [Pirellulaceae bacterium]